MISSIVLQMTMFMVLSISTMGFTTTMNRVSLKTGNHKQAYISRNTLQMNFFEDAVRFFSNMKKEASAKHILIKGSDAVSKLTIIKSELVGVEDLSAAFSDLAAKVPFYRFLSS